MFVFGNFIIAVAKILGVVLWALEWMIIIRVIASWLSADPYNPIVQFLYRMTEPILMPFRRYLPRTNLDISPIIAIFLIFFLRIFLVNSLLDLGFHLRY